MKYTIAITLILLLSINNITTNAQSSSKQKIDAIEVQENSPFFGDSYYRIYHAGPYIIYQSQYLYTMDSMRFDSTSNQFISDENSETMEKRIKYFVFHKDSTHGISFDPKDSLSNNKRLLIESETRLVRGSNTYENIIKNKPDSVTKDKTTLREVYACDCPSDQPNIRFVLYYSSNMNHLKESLNETVDKAKKMKLNKIEIQTDEFYDKRVDKLLPPMVSVTELKEISVTDDDEINKLIAQYQQSVGIKN
jgi:hypothetical protein